MPSGELFSKKQWTRERWANRVEIRGLLRFELQWEPSIWWTGSWSPFHILITFAHCLSKARSSLNPFWYYEWALQQIISDHKAIKTLVKPLKQLWLHPDCPHYQHNGKHTPYSFFLFLRNTLTPGTYNSWTSPSLDKVPVAQFQAAGQVGIIWGVFHSFRWLGRTLYWLQVNVIAIGFLKERECVWLIPGTCEGL